MSDGNKDGESFEEKLRAIGREISRSIERAAQLDLDELAEAIGVSSERAKEFAETAGRWFAERADHPDAGVPAEDVPPHRPTEEDRGGHGPHPLDLPSEQQGLALAALDSGRWRVEPGTDVLIGDGLAAGPKPAIGVVGELRARDWIAADGVVTLVGREALRRWLDHANAPEQPDR